MSTVILVRKCQPVQISIKVDENQSDENQLLEQHVYCTDMVINKSLLIYINK